MWNLLCQEEPSSSLKFRVLAVREPRYRALKAIPLREALRATPPKGLHEPSARSAAKRRCEPEGCAWEACLECVVGLWLAASRRGRSDVGGPGIAARKRAPTPRVTPCVSNSEAVSVAPRRNTGLAAEWGGPPGPIGMVSDRSVWAHPQAVPIADPVPQSHESMEVLGIRPLLPAPRPPCQGTNP
jgi:hypothetical protein